MSIGRPGGAATRPGSRTWTCTPAGRRLDVSAVRGRSESHTHRSLSARVADSGAPNRTRISVEPTAGRSVRHQSDTHRRSTDAWPILRSSDTRLHTRRAGAETRVRSGAYRTRNCTTVREPVMIVQSVRARPHGHGAFAGRPSDSWAADSRPARGGWRITPPDRTACAGPQPTGHLDSRGAHEALDAARPAEHDPLTFRCGPGSPAGRAADPEPCGRKGRERGGRRRSPCTLRVFVVEQRRPAALRAGPAPAAGGTGCVAGRAIRGGERC